MRRQGRKVKWQPYSIPTLFLARFARRSLQFLNFEHLDIKCLSEATRKRSIEEGDGEEEMEDGAGGRVSLSSTTSTGSTTSVSPPEDLWSVPLEALRQVDAVKSPIEKLEKIMFASSSITVALRAALGEGENGQEP